MLICTKYVVSLKTHNMPDFKTEISAYSWSPFPGINLTMWRPYLNNNTLGQLRRSIASAAQSESPQADTERQHPSPTAAVCFSLEFYSQAWTKPFSPTGEGAREMTNKRFKKGSFNFSSSVATSEKLN